MLWNQSDKLCGELFNTSAGVDWQYCRLESFTYEKGVDTCFTLWGFSCSPTSVKCLHLVYSGLVHRWYSSLVFDLHGKNPQKLQIIFLINHKWITLLLLFFFLSAAWSVNVAWCWRVIRTYIVSHGYYR